MSRSIRRRLWPLVAISSWVTFAVAAPAACAASILSLRPETTDVGLYEKFEVTIDLQANYTNPFDSDQIDVSAEFTSPSGKTWHIWGFYNPSSWSSLWMIRFAPTEIGTWQYVVTAVDGEGRAQSTPNTFRVTESGEPGFVGVAPNGRYLQHTDGSSLYPVGLWYNDSYEQFAQGRITQSGLDELRRRGANFISFFPTPLETMGTGLGRYDQNRCGRLDQLFQWCEERDIRISWNLWFHSYLSEAVWGGGNARYRNNPYRLATDATGFFASDEAWRYQLRLYRYIIARWGYSRALFLWFIVDEINGTEGWTEGDRALAEEWCRKVDRYFHEHDPYGRPTTGTQSGGIGQWWPAGYRIFDVAAREIYEAQGHPMPKTGKPKAGDSPLRYSYRNYAKQTRALWDGFHKPAMIGECGWDHTYYEAGMPGYLAMYHNALWVSLANGLCATPFWWSYSDRINDSVVTDQMLHFARFVERIDFANLDLRPGEIDAGPCDAWVMRTDQFAFGWLVNPETSVANESATLLNMPDGAYDVQLYRTWRGSFLDKQTALCRGGKLSLTVPELRTRSGHASHIGHDVAFQIQRR